MIATIKKNNKKLTTDEFIKDAKKIHGDKYDYSLVNYYNAHTKIDIICKIHGVFHQKPNSHKNGYGCPKCGFVKVGNIKRNSKNDFIKKAIKVHGDRYIYDNVEYIKSKENVTIICKIHGAFQQKPNAHVRGQGCQECAKITVANLHRSSKEEFIKKAREIHGDKYSYDNVIYSNAMNKVEIECPTHGIFLQLPSQHFVYGCNKCSHEYISELYKDDIHDFIKKSIKTHGYKYDYSSVSYKKSNIKVDIICKTHGVFRQMPYSHVAGKGCPSCGLVGPSKGEIELSEYISSFVDIELSNRTIIKPKEIDCFIPSKKLGIEFCGVHYHSDRYRDKNYHINKLKITNNAGCDLIQVFDDEWIEKKSIVKSIIKNRIGFSSNKIYARKTKINNVSIQDSKQFLDNNHIQGYSNAEIRIGLYYENNLVMIATFSDKRRILGHMNKGWYELVRLCSLNDTVIIGGFSKILKHFISTYSPNGIKTYCDKRYFNGDGYKAVGFVKSHDSRPSYYYIKNEKRYSRFMYQKHKQKEKLKTFSDKLTEHENMIANGYSRIHDCGNHVFVMDLTN